jgi:pSer/pThr/pTyr-binding forkhead associated (FHA) protein
MKICKGCGSKQNDDVVFCSECGFMEFEENKSKKNTKNEASEKTDTQTVYDESIKEDTDNEIDLLKTQQNESYENLRLGLLNEEESVNKTWTLSKLPSYTLGRISSKGSVDIDFSEVDGGAYISRKHAKIYKKDNQWYFVDLDSKYGSEIITQTAREIVVAKEEYLLKKGDILVLAKKIKLEIS